MKNKRISITAILIYFIIALTLGLLFISIYQQPTTYVDQMTVFLTFLFSIIILFVVRDSTKHNNPLLIVLSWWSIFFYILRVVTLNYTEYSVCLARCDASAGDVNKALAITILSVVALWLVLHKINTRSSEANFTVRYRHSYIKKALVIYWIAFVINVFADYNFPLSGFALIIRNFILNIYYLLYFFLVYIILVWDKIESKDKIYAVLSIIAFVLFLTITGSRSAFYSIFKMFFFIFLALGYKKVKSIYVIGGLLMVPVMFTLFIYTTYMRQTNMENASLDSKIALVSEVLEHSEQIDSKLLVSPIFDRVGYLDYTTEMIVNSKSFRQFINFKTEFKSIVDNALTPGFDVFDAPRVSNVISNSYIYDSSVLLTKSSNSQYEYHSDELTAFGEAYILLGFPLGIILVAWLAYIIKNVWRKAELIRNEKGIFIKSMCLYLFEVLLSSYGFDWYLLDVICFIMTYIIFEKYVFAKKHGVRIPKD